MLFEGNDPCHLVGATSAHALLGNIANQFLKLRVDKELSKASKVLYHSTVNKYVKPNATINVERTRLSENQLMPHVTEKMLGHELGGIMAIYNKHDWLDEQLVGY